MKKPFFLSSRKSFKNNLFSVLSLMLSLVVVLAIITIVIASQAISRQTKSEETQKLSTVGYRYTNYIDQISLINTSFALSKIDFEGTWAEKDLYAYNSVEYQSNLCMTMYEFIKGMYIKSRNSEVKKGTILFPVDTKNAKETFLYDVRSSKLSIIQDDSAYSLYLYQKSTTDAPYENDVYINIDGFEMGQNITNTYSPSEKELIVYEDGTILVSSLSYLPGKNIFEEFAAPKNCLKENGLSLSSLKDGLNLSAQKIEGTPLFAVRVFDNSLYRSFYVSIWTIIIILDLFILIIFVLASYFLTKFTYRPVQQIIDSVSSYYPLPILKDFDEVNYIKDTVSELSTSNISLSESNRDNLVALQQQQMLAMQAQISPHFMFNMLDTVSWMSIDLLEEKNPIEKILKSICSILKYSMDLTTSFATIRQELEIAQHCIHVLKIRYDIDIDFSFEVEKGLIDCKMLKLCFEPIIENSIIHGFANKRSSGEIKIKVYKAQNDMLGIEISDNGIGMKPEVKRDLLERINNFKDTDSKHIGLKNVNLRLHLLYGDKYNFKLESEYQKGTVFYIEIPFIEF
ncbi:MAG: histidine kinase [Clostridia bacterium]|nr:histidine kinase [Clostridia bacterium]